MIQIRFDMFETNSSSCHVFMFPKGMEIKIPPVVFLDDSGGSKDNMPNLYFNDINFGEDYTTPFIQMLYRCGVKEIKYTGTDKYVTEAIEKYKDEDNSNANLHIDKNNFTKAVFGVGTKVTTMEDYLVCDEEIAKLGDFEDWHAIRLS